jgi:hypothetical protein
MIEAYSSSWVTPISKSGENFLHYHLRAVPNMEIALLHLSSLTQFEFFISA